MVYFIPVSVVSGTKSGQDYYLGYIRNRQNAQPGIIIMTTESQPVHYLIEAPGVGYYSSGIITCDSDIFVTLPNNLITGSYNYKGIHLMIDSHEVNVIGQNLRYDSSDTFLCLPVTTLCLIEYVYYGISVPSVADPSNRFTSILIVSTENDTVIKLIATQPVSIYVNKSPTKINNFPVNLTAGMQYLHESKINKLHTLHIGSFYDLTGIKIVTNKPVFVSSGHRCGTIPPDADDPSCDHLVEQVLPTTLWGTECYTAPLATRRSYTIKVLAAFNSTVVDIYCNNTRESYNISEGEYMNKTLSMQEYCAIKSTRPVLVAQFSHGQGDDTTGNGDPMMTLVPATNQYNSNFRFSTLKSQLDFTHYINIIVLAEYYQPDLIYLISGGVNKSLDNHQWVPIVINSVTEAYGIQVNISKGISEVFHGNTSALMTTSVYGFADNNAYGHPGGYSTIKACAGCYIM